jgi:ABC-2 type transport system permease protein
MRKTLAVALNDLRLIFADGSVWINLVIVPVVLSVAIGYGIGAMMGGGAAERPLPIDLLDEDHSVLSRSLVAEMVRANSNILLCPAGGSATLDPECNSGGAIISPDRLQSRLLNEQSAAYLHIPAGFETSVLRGDALPVIYRSGESAMESSPLFAALEAAATNVGVGVATRHTTAAIGNELAAFAMLDAQQQDEILSDASGAALARISAAPFEVRREVAFAEAEEVEASSGLAQSIPGMGSMYAVIATLAMAAAFVRDRKQGVIQRALTMAVRPAQLMGGKVLAYFTIGLLQISLLFVLGAIMGLRFGSDLFALMAVMIAFTFAVTGLALFVTSLVSTDSQAQSIGLLVGLVMGPLGGAWWPLQIVPNWMQTVGHLTPIAWAMDGYSALIYRDAGWNGVWLPVVVLLGMAVLFFTLGLWRIRVREA